MNKYAGTKIDNAICMHADLLPIFCMILLHNIAQKINCFSYKLAGAEIFFLYCK